MSHLEASFFFGPDPSEGQRPQEREREVGVCGGGEVRDNGGWM